MPKNLKFENEARSLLLEGVEMLNKAVTATMGPQGRYVLIGKGQYGKVMMSHPTKDGVTVAKEVDDEDYIKSLAINVVRQAAEKTAEEAGDGTTTATLLAYHLVKEGLKAIDSGVNPVKFKKGMNIAVAEITKYISSVKEEVGEDYDKIKNVATVSANNDAKLGEMIANAFREVGSKGIVRTRPSETGHTFVEIKRGSEFGRGFASPYFINSEDGMTVSMEEARILFVDDKIDSIKQLLPILEYIGANNLSLVIIANEFDPQLMATLVVNRQRGMKIAAVKAPYVGADRKNVLTDLATITGGTVISSELGMSLEDVTDEYLGMSEKITITKDTTQIINGYGTEEDITARVEVAKASWEGPADDEIVNRRVSILQGKAAVLNIGAKTEAESKEVADRVDDALSATRAAIEEGIVAGGGVTLLKAVESVRETLKVVDDEVMVLGIKAVIEACHQPLIKILSNAGYDENEFCDIVAKVASNSQPFYGFDLFSEKYEHNMIAAGIIDPAKVTRVALENAASVAAMIITTDCTITNVE
jgi:chaperonin GroEL